MRTASDLLRTPWLTSWSSKILTVLAGRLPACHSLCQPAFGAFGAFSTGDCRHYFAYGAVVQWLRDINRAKRGAGYIGGVSLVQNMLLVLLMLFVLVIVSIILPLVQWYSGGGTLTGQSVVPAILVEYLWCTNQSSQPPSEQNAPSHIF